MRSSLSAFEVITHSLKTQTFSIKMETKSKTLRCSFSFANYHGFSFVWLHEHGRFHMEDPPNDLEKKVAN